MKLSILLITLVLTGSLMAATKSEEQAKVRMMLQEIEASPKKLRFEKMNAFKVKIQTMNREVQGEANQKLIKLQERLRLRINKGIGQGEQLHQRHELSEEEKTKLKLQEQEMLQMQRQEQMKSQKRMNQPTNIPSKMP